MTKNMDAAALALLPGLAGDPLESDQLENYTQFEVARGSPAITTGDLVMFIMVSAIARVFHGIPVFHRIAVDRTRSQLA